MAEIKKCSDSLENIFNKISAFQAPLIFMHARPDADTVGSAFALASFLRMLGRSPRCVCADEIPSRLAFLMTGQSDVAFDEKIEYDGMIAVDVASVQQLGTLSCLADKFDVMIDHHGRGELFAKEYYVDACAAATGEIIFDMLNMISEREHIALNKDIAVRLYAAISSDTGSFKYGNTTPYTHMRAARLLEYGVDNAEISRMLFESKSPKVLAAERLAYEKMQWFRDGKITAAVITNEDKKKYELSDCDLETAIDIVRCSEGAAVSFVIKEQDGRAGSYRVSMRSFGGFDVSAVCATFGGGGHAAAAGCTVEENTAEKALETILGEIEKSLP